MRTIRALFIIISLAGMGIVSAVHAVQHVDVGFESPASMNRATTISSGIVYDKILEDDLTYYCISEEAGTNWLWISGSQGYAGSRCLGARCYAVDSPVKDRAEFRSVMWTQPYALTFGQEMYYGYAMKIATSTMPTNWMHIMQAWQGNSGPKVPITLSYDLSQNTEWKYNLDVRTMTSTTTIGSFVFDPGDWYKLIWKLRPSYPGFGGGSIDLWVNDSLVVSWQGDWGLEPGTTNTAPGSSGGVLVTNLDLRCGIYRGHQATEQILLFDQIEYADSYYEADPDTEIDWGFRSDAEGWTVRQDVEKWVPYGDCVAGDITGGDSSLYSPDNLNIDCASSSYILIKMKNSSSSGKSSVFFTTDSSEAFSADKRLDAMLVKNDPDYTIYEFNAAGNTAWTGTLKRLRFDPIDDIAVTNGSFSIDFIDLSAGPSYGAKDLDLDGFSNDQELITGTDAYDSASFPALQIGSSIEGNTPAISYYAAPGRLYSLYTSTNLFTGNWVPFGESFTGNGTVVTQAIPSEATNMFYRTQISLP